MLKNPVDKPQRDWTHIHTKHPPYNDSWVDSGVNSAPIEFPPGPMYAQSNEIENTPNPSLPAAPPGSMMNNNISRIVQKSAPKTRVNQALS